MKLLILGDPNAFKRVQGATQRKIAQVHNVLLSQGMYVFMALHIGVTLVISILRPLDILTRGTRAPFSRLLDGFGQLLRAVIVVTP